MILIGVDTSGKNGSLTVARVADGASIVILETVALEGGTFSAQLIPQLAELLERQDLSKRDIDGFAVASGPGSFTGLRVGLAAVKGMAEALQKPIAAVSLLEAVARASADRHVVAALDAGRNELYLAEYEDGVMVGEEQLVPRQILVSSTALKVITTDEALAASLREAGRSADVVQHPGSARVAKIGWTKLQAGERVTPQDLEANYIRRSDAEIFKDRV
jgi:tRNA threonylcarbamoyladenosine biosynthesis protein TsaB